jgi:hypothetical protein
MQELIAMKDSLEKDIQDIDTKKQLFIQNVGSQVKVKSSQGQCGICNNGVKATLLYLLPKRDCEKQTAEAASTIIKRTSLTCRQTCLSTNDVIE